MFDEAAVLEAATEVLWRRGATQVSLNELAAEVGASKPALARAFGGKDELTARALERYFERMDEQVSEALAGGGGVRDLAERYLEVFVRAHTDETGPPGCFLAASMSDCASVADGPIRETLDRLGSQGLVKLKQALSDAGADEPGSLADFLMGQTIAMSVMARSGASREDLARFAATALRAVEGD